MKRILASILLLPLLFPSLAFGVTIDDLVKRDGIYYKKFSDAPFTGKTVGRVQGSLLNGVWHGPYESYEKDRDRISWILRAKGTHKNGKQHGPWVVNILPFVGPRYTIKVNFKDGEHQGLYTSFWLKTGNLMEKKYYKNDLIHGPYVFYHENGELGSKGTYKDGKRHGPWVAYFPNGRLRFDGTYENGKEEGSWVSYKKVKSFWNKKTFRYVLNNKFSGHFENGVKVK